MYRKGIFLYRKIWGYKENQFSFTFHGAISKKVVNASEPAQRLLCNLHET